MLPLLPYYARVLGWTGSFTIVVMPCCLVGLVGIVAADDPALAVAVTLIAGGFTATLVGHFLWRFRPAAEGLRLATVGRPARARIDAMEETGVTVGTSFLVRFRLTVSPAAGPPYAATCLDLVPRLAIGGFASGAEIDVMVDPEDPTRVTVRPAENPGGAGP
ncbi:MAG: hypothetical protein EBZ74_06975 [Planctomycetia bacterium]|nr:hypothetical protein [Planctomycetia bacterium]